MSEAQDTKGQELKDTLPPTQVVAIGYDIIGAISDNAQMTFHHAIAEDETDASINGKIDRIMAIIDRQRAKYEAPGLEKELVDLQDKLMLLDGDVAQAEANYKKAQADLDVQIETFQGSIKRITEEGYEAHKSRGKQGSYVPAGNAKQNIEAAQNGIRSAAENKARSTAERDLFLSNIDTNKQRMVARVEFLTQRLADIKEQVT